jgi:hypothetical protein
MLLAACGNDGGSADTSQTESSTGAATDSDTDGDPGVRVLFDVDADVSTPETFYAMPFPSDLRLSPEGYPVLTGMPAGDTLSVTQITNGAQERPGWAAVGATYFVFDGPIAPRDRTDLIPADVTSPILLLDVDPASPDRGTLYPAIAATLPVDVWVPENMLSVGPYSGQVLPGDRKYAVVVQRALGDAGGAPLAVPDAIAAMASGEVPPGANGPAAAELLTPMWETLDMIGVPRTEVAAATVFTVEDIPMRTFEMSELVLQQHDITFDGLTLEPDGGADHERFCELFATIEMPQFNRGTPPFDVDGSFDYDGMGAPVKQRDETVRIVFTIPKQEMPKGGWPLLHYIHGSGGLSSQVVDRGPVTEPGGAWTPGLGPAHVVAEHGLAALGAGMPLNPERTPTADDIDYINIANPRSFAYVFRQGVFEQRLISEALDGFTIDPTVLQGCDGPTLPAGEPAHYFNLDRIMMMGQSMGGQYTNLTSPLEPKVKAVVPSGAGGLWNKFLGISPLFNDGVKQFTAGLLEISPDDVNQLHPGVNLIELAWEPGEQIVYANRIAQRPLPGHDARHIYQPVAPGDEYFPSTLYDAMAISYGTQQAGMQVWDTMQPELAIFGLDGIAPYPVTGNRTNEQGETVTAVVVQYPADEYLNAHYIFQQLDEVKYQYGCFLATFWQNGTPTVPAPAALGTPCP